MKGRSVANRSTEQERCAGVNTSSPTVSTNALMMSILIDTWKGHDVACADVPGAYLHADIDSFTLIRYEGKSVDILCKINPDWEKFVTIEGGKKVLYFFTDTSNLLYFGMSYLNIHSTTCPYTTCPQIPTVSPSCGDDSCHNARRNLSRCQQRRSLIMVNKNTILRNEISL